MYAKKRRSNNNRTYSSRQNYNVENKSSDGGLYEDDLMVAARAAAADANAMYSLGHDHHRGDDSSSCGSSSSGDDGDNPKDSNMLSYLIPYGSSDEEDGDENDESNTGMEQEATNCSSSDDESDVDLTEALAKMTADDDDVEEQYEKKKGKKSSSGQIRGPKTTNEIDIYDSALPLNDATAVLTSVDLSIDRLNNIKLRDLGFAGNIKFHLANERILVVESSPSVSLQSPLDEGSVMVLYDRLDGELHDRPILLGKVVSRIHQSQSIHCFFILY